MDSTSGDIKKIDFVNELFGFIKKHFNNFEHKKRSGNETWFTPSWSPFTGSFFIEFGNNKGLLVGSSFTHQKLKLFWTKYIKSPYKKPVDRGYDISWHDTDFNFVLGLEHEEHGKTSSGGLKEVVEELEKLRFYKGKYKILISRPYFNTIQSYLDVEKDYKKEIEEKIRNLDPNDDEIWIIILIGLKEPLSGQTNEILFSCNFWNKIKNELSEFEDGFKIPIKWENGQLKLEEGKST